MLLQVSPTLILNVNEILQAVNQPGEAPLIVIQFRRDDARIEKQIRGEEAEAVWHSLQLYAARSLPDNLGRRPSDKQTADLIELLDNAIKQGETDAERLAHYVLYTLGFENHPDPQSA